MDRRTVTPRWAVGRLEQDFPPGSVVEVTLIRKYRSGGYVEPTTQHAVDVIGPDGRLLARGRGKALERVVRDIRREWRSLSAGV